MDQNQIIRNVLTSWRGIPHGEWIQAGGRDYVYTWLVTLTGTQVALFRVYEDGTFRRLERWPDAVYGVLSQRGKTVAEFTVLPVVTLDHGSDDEEWREWDDHAAHNHEETTP